MTEPFTLLEGKRVTSLRLVAAARGPWYAECDLEDASEITLGAKVTLKVGAQSYLGTVTPSRSGTFGEQRKVRLVGGAGGWATTLKPQHYHNDAGVKARLVAEDAARSSGEQLDLDAFAPERERLGIDYVRQSGSASRALEDAAGERPWWVGFDGKTRVGTRPSSTVPSSSYQVLSYDPRARFATLGIDDPSVVDVGSRLIDAERLDGERVVQELNLFVRPDGLRAVVWFGDELTDGRLASVLTAIVARATDKPLHGLYRYRCMRMAAGGRVELQAVRKLAGLPDVLPVSQLPGAPGIAAELAPGAEVFVQFLEGDRTQPVVTHYAGPDGVGFAPESMVVGGKVGPDAARRGDAVEVLLAPAVFSGTISGAPATGVLTFPAMKATGVITGGSGRVKVAT